MNASTNSNDTDMDTSSDPAATEPDQGPRSPLRTMQVMHALAGTESGIPLAVLASQLQLPKTSLFRLLRSLESGGYVISVNGVHQIGPAGIKLGVAIVRNQKFPNCARPMMEWLANESSETVILGTISDDGNDVIYTDVIEPTNPLRFIIKAGSVKPMYCSASGLMILAYMPAAQRKHYLETVDFVRYAPKTITSATLLKRKLKQITDSGIAVSEEGMFAGVYSIAAPIVDATGAVQAGISISAPSTRGIPQEEKFAALVSQAGEEISRLLGYAGTYPPH